MIRVLWLIPAALTLGCTHSQKKTLTPAEFATLPWDDVVRRARGTTVTFAMWAGDEDRNRYFRGPVAAQLAQEFDVTLRIVPLADTAEAVNKLLNEKSAGKTADGSMDLLWINGENFRTAKQGAVLWGPFADRLPNIRYYDDEIRKRDFGTAVEGFEAPWQKAQFVMAYDSARVADPPQSIEELGSWIKSHPGRFTYIAPPDFTGSVFIRHILLHFGGGAQPFQQRFNADLYRKASAATITYLNELEPFLWRKGQTYPATLREMDRLFANQEIDFAMSYSPNFAIVRIERGEYPPTTRTFAFRAGTIGNYNFLAIPFNASNPLTALVLINHLMSFDRLLDLARVLKTPFPLAPERLAPEQRDQVRSLPFSAELDGPFLPEPDAEYLVRLEKDWREKVLQQ